MRRYFFSRAETAGVILRDSHSARLDNLVFAEFIWPDTAQLILRDSSAVLEAYAVYAGPLFMIALALNIYWFFTESEQIKRAIAYLFVPAIGFWSMVVLAVRPAGPGRPPGRYMLFNAPTVIVLGCISLYLLLRHFRKNVVIQQVLIGLVVLPPLVSAILITQPAPVTVTMYRQDRGRIVPDNGARQVLVDTANAIVDDARGNRAQVLIFSDVNELQAVVGAPWADFTSVVSFTEAEWQAVQQATIDTLLAGPPYYLVEEVGYVSASEYAVAPRTFDEHPFADDGILVGEYGSDVLRYRVYRLELVQEHVVDEAYKQLIDAPEQYAPDYQAYVDAYPDDQRLAFIFPEDHANFIRQSHKRSGVSDLVVETWPMGPEAVLRGLADSDVPLETPGTYDVLVIDEARSDQDNQLALHLLKIGYFLDETFYGRVHRYTFQGGPVDPSLRAVNAVFENTIVLEEAILLTEQVEKQNTILVAMNWSTRTPVGDSFVVFTHVLNQSDALIAQYDSVPRRGLLPLTEWEEDDLIHERFALRLPDDLPEGTYRVVTGLYFPESGIRLSITDGDNLGASAVVLDTFEIGAAQE